MNCGTAKASMGKCNIFGCRCLRSRERQNTPAMEKCDCVHRSEETWAAIEQKQKSDNRREKRKREKEALAESPLAASNPKFQVKL